MDHRWLEILIKDSLLTFSSVNRIGGPQERLIFWPQEFLDVLYPPEVDLRWVGLNYHFSEKMTMYLCLSKKLDAREKKILFMRYGKPFKVSYRKIGKEVGISHEMVRRSLNSSLAVIDHDLPQQGFYAEGKVKDIINYFEQCFTGAL